ncbi:MAG: hypothetical protein WCN87_03290, partial [Chlamydiota bacterium]
GKLDQIITSSSYERRFILEEAAGIMRFKQRKKETLKKLQQAEENLIRLQDIGELLIQKKEHLLIQGEKAQLFLELEKSAIALEKNLALYEMKKLEEKMVRLVKQMEKSLLELFREEIQELESQKKQVLLEEKTRSLENQELLKKIYEKRAALEIKKQQLEWALKRKEKRFLEQKELLHKTEEAAAEKIILLEDIQKSEGEISQNSLEELKADLQNIALEEAAIWREKNLYAERKMARLREENKLKNSTEEVSFRLRNALDKKEKLESEQIRLEGEIKRDEGVGIAFYDSAVEDSKQEVLFKSEKEKLLAAEERSLQIEEMEKARQASLLQGKISALEGLKKTFQGYSSCAKKLLAEGRAKALSELISWKEEFEKVLTPYEHLLVVTPDVFLEGSLQDVTLFCPDWLEGRSLEEHFLGAQKLDTIPSRLEKEAFGQNFRIDSKGVLFLESKGPSTVFSRKRELDGLVEQLKEIESALKNIRESKKRVGEEKENALRDLQDSLRVLKEKEMSKAAAEAALIRLMREKERLGRIISEKESLAALLEDVILKKSAAEEAYNRFQADKEPEPLFDLAEMSSRKSFLEAAFKEKNRLTQHFSSLLNRQKERLSHIEAQLSSLEERKSRLLAEKEEEFLPINGEEEELQLLERAYEEISLIIKGLNSRIESLQIHLEEKLQEADKARSLLEKQGLEKAQNETVLSMLEERYRQQFGEKESYPEAALPGNLEALKEQMTSLGAINFSAVEELEAAEQEAEALTSQIADLEKAKEDLYGIISALDKESGERFLATYTQVRASFKRNFTTLFGGGDADLQLVGSEDPLESGLDIYAMPPGKSMKSLYLMSGGERCLTALALLFALFEVRPSAFCLLDEVDAPLDEANVERFAKMVSSYIDKTQFVIITHNKNTMAIADRLLGVSAEEKGVSKVIPLELKR